MTILFLCVGNSCRSIMAEAMANALGEGGVDACSAGFSPAGFVADDTVATLRSLGYRADGLSSKGLDAVPLDDVDVIVSMIGDTGLQLVPTRLAASRESWVIRDPFGEDSAVYRSVAKEIEGRVQRLLAGLDGREPGLGG